jgi:hypothetical protein
MLSIRATAVACLMLFIGCGGGGDESTSHNVTPEFNAAQQRWTAANIQNYQLTLTTQCFCVGNPAVITVKNGKIDSAFDRRTGTSLTSMQIASLQTVNDLFATARSAYTSGAYSVQATYDTTYGYPTKLSIDWNKQAADDEVTYLVSEFM